MAVSSSLFFVLSLSETDARVVEAIEAVVEAAELAAFACDAKKRLSANVQLQAWLRISQ